MLLQMYMYVLKFEAISILDFTYVWSMENMVFHPNNNFTVFIITNSKTYIMIENKQTDKAIPMYCFFFERATKLVH